MVNHVLELNELIASIDIVAFISQFVELEQRGDEWWGLSCFKAENTPSFSVRRDPPFFYDYSSGVGGNVFTFVKRYYGCSSREAVEILEKYAGVEGDLAPQCTKLDATLSCMKFRRKKTQEKEEKGVVLPEDVMLRYEKRPDKLRVWENEGISAESLEKFQVRYDAFSDRLVYPIRDVSGRIVNIGGRTLDPAFKEKGLRKYTYFYKWGKLDVIYGLYDNLEEIRKRREIILFEGCKSVLLADTWGIRNTGALLTSHLNPQQMKLLAKLGCRVVFALDKEVRVRDDHNIRKLQQYVTVQYLRDTKNLLSEKDSPVDRGEEVFRTLYEQRYKYT